MEYKTFSIILFLVAGMGGLLLLGYLHEQVHVAIFRSYGINSSVQYYENFPDWTTTPDSNCPVDSCTLAHNITDAIGYHLQAFYALIFIGIMLLILNINNIYKPEILSNST